MDRLPSNCLAIWGKIFWILCALSGIVSIVCMLILLDPYTQDYIEFAIVGLSTGAFSVLTALVAVPLAYKGAQKYLKRKNSTGLKGVMITAWVFYGILVVSALALAVVAALMQFISPLWFICEVSCGMFSWPFMYFYQLQAQKLQSDLPLTNEESRTYNHEPPARKSQSDLPMTYAESSLYNSAPSNPSINIETRVNEDGTRTRTTIKRSIHKDGTITVEKTMETLGVGDV